MKLMVINRKHSYLITENDLPTVELGSIVLNPEENKLYMILNPGVLTEINNKAIQVETLEELTKAIATGGSISITENIVAPTAFTITADSVITNNNVISVPEDTEGNGVFMITEGTLTLNGTGTINGVGNNDWNMALWAKENGKVIINNGYFTNEGATADVDPEHFDLIYASGNAQIEINGGEFKCQTPKWTLNVKDKDRATANIIVKGGKFYGFDPSNCESEGPNTNFVAPGYKVVEEESGVFVVMPE
jgi:hypothetical protein